MDEDAKPIAAPIHPAVNFALGLAGAAAGGGLGWWLFGWLTQQGFYALPLPGALAGLGAGLLAKRRSLALSIVCGALALAVCVGAEWSHFPFTKDDSFGYFISHLSDLRPFTLLMMALGGFCGFWFAWRGRAK